MKIQEVKQIGSLEQLIIIEIRFDKKLSIEHFRYFRRCGKLDYFVFPYFRCKFFNEQLILLGAVGNKRAKLWINDGFENVILENLAVLLQAADSVSENISNNAETSL